MHVWRLNDEHGLRSGCNSTNEAVWVREFGDSSRYPRAVGGLGTVQNIQLQFRYVENLNIISYEDWLRYDWKSDDPLLSTNWPVLKKSDAIRPDTGRGDIQ